MSARPRDPSGGGNHPKSLGQSLEASPRRLGTSYFDVFWGISDFPAWRVAQIDDHR